MDDIPLVRESLPYDHSEQNRLLQGCTFIEDALNFRLTYHRVDSRSLKVYRLYHSRPIQWSINVVLIVLHGLIFFEAPSSLSKSADIRTCQGKSFQECRVVIPPYILLPIEGICLVLLSFDCFIKIYSFGARQIRSYPWHVAYAICLFASVVGWFTALLVPCCNTWPYCGNVCKWRCLLRPAFLIQHSSIIKKALKCLIKALPSILSVLMLIFLHLLLFTLIGLALFPIDKGPVQINPDDDDEGSTYFSTASVALINMFVLLTTSNNPNISTAAYNENRFYALFFIVYVAIGIYCFLYILLAVVFQQFREYFKESLRHRVLRRRAGLVSAYHVLSDSDLATGKRFIPARRLSAVISNLIISKEAKARIYQRFIDELKYIGSATSDQRDLSEANLTWKQFFKRVFPVGISDRRQKYVDTLRAGGHDPLNANAAGIRYAPTFNNDDDENVAQVSANQSGFSRCFRMAIKGLRFALSHLYFVHFGSILNVVNVILVIIQTSDDERKVAMEPPSYIFVCYYIIEQMGVMWAIGARNYFRVWLHRMDFFFSTLILLATLVYLSVNAWTSPEIIAARYATVGIAHILMGCRLGRVVLSLKMPHLIVRTMADLLVNLTPFLGLLMAQYYFFAVLGMILFSNSIQYKPEMEGCWHWDNKSDNCRPPYSNMSLTCPYGNDFHSSQFWAQNFNDFASSVVVLWNLMVVNNWQVLLAAYSNAANGAAQIYFILWYILTVLISLDLFIAVIVENFNTRWNVYSEEKQRRQMMEKQLADAAAGKRPSARQSRVTNRTGDQSRQTRARSQSQPMRLAYILGVDAPNMEQVREHLASNPYYPADYAEDPDAFLAVYDTDSGNEEDDEIHSSHLTSRSSRPISP